ncbi:MAG: hypothetical protein WEA56_07585 [Balneolaceae bacterium]
MPAANRQNYKLIAILTATLAAGLPLWTSTSRQIDFTGISFLAGWLVLGFISALFVRFFINLKTKDMISSFIVGYVLAVIVYFVGRVLLANIIHPQFLLSLVIAMIAGSVSGWLGSLFWSWIKRKNRE